MKYRDVRAALLRQGCRSKLGKGDREKRYCSCGKHIAVITKGGVVSPGVVADTINASQIKNVPCLPKGWLQ